MGTDASLAAIKRPIGVDDLRPLIDAAGIDATVIVQTIPDMDETREFLEIAEQTDFVRGVVGWADLTARDLPRDLAALKAGPGGRYLVGIRHQAHDEDDPDWLARPDVVAGIRYVLEADLAYELLVKERELPSAIRCVDSLPNDARLIVDHIAKPRIAAGELEPWKGLMTNIASRPNVWCKLSGMVTEADWTSWSPADLRPYADHVLSAFGPERVIFGSDWPVCLLAASYGEVVDTAESLIGGLTPSERAAIMGGNAARFYRLSR
jgi:L-fuconolactonase